MIELETPRLLLRPWRPKDADDLYEYARDPRVGPIAGWPVHRDREESLQIIGSVFAAPHVFAMELRESGKVVGSVGYTDSHRTELPAPDDEVGYCLNPDYWGQGLMPEAVREVLRHGFKDMGLAAAWCNHYDGNAKSKRVIEKCGFRYRFSQETDAALMGERRMTHFYAMTRAEWEGSP